MWIIIASSMPENMAKGLSGGWGIIGYIIGISIFWAISQAFLGGAGGTIATIILSIILILYKIL